MTTTSPTSNAFGAGAALPPSVAPLDAPSLRSLSIVLPCFDEEANLPDAIRNAASAAAMTSEDYEIIVVDDGSSDATAGVGGRFAEADPRVRLIVHARNRGYGDAVRSGIGAARKDWVLLTDADLQFDLRELEDFVPCTRSAEALWGFRILRHDTVRRRLGTTAWNRLVRNLFRVPVRDVDCGFKLVRRDMLERVELRTNGAMINTELAVGLRAQGARFQEIGVHHRARVAGEEAGKPRTVVHALRELASRHRTLRRLSRVAG